MQRSATPARDPNTAATPAVSTAGAAHAVVRRRPGVLTPLNAAATASPGTGSQPRPRPQQPQQPQQQQPQPQPQLATAENQTVERPANIDPRVLAAFRKYDADHSNTISRDEATDMVKALGLQVSDSYFDRAWAAYDADASGYLHLEEFAKMMDEGIFRNALREAEDVSSSPRYGVAAAGAEGPLRVRTSTPPRQTRRLGLPRQQHSPSIDSQQRESETALLLQPMGMSSPRMPPSPAPMLPARMGSPRMPLSPAASMSSPPLRPSTSQPLERIEPHRGPAPARALGIPIGNVHHQMWPNSLHPTQLAAPGNYVHAATTADVHARMQPADSYPWQNKLKLKDAARKSTRNQANSRGQYRTDAAGRKVTSVRKLSHKTAHGRRVMLTLGVYAYDHVTAYYNGEKLGGLDSNLDKLYQTVTFQYIPDAVLAVEVTHNKARLGSLICKCSATYADTGKPVGSDDEHPAAPWNFSLFPSNAELYVRAWCVKDSTSRRKQPEKHKDTELEPWLQNEYVAEDAADPPPLEQWPAPVSLREYIRKPDGEDTDEEDNVNASIREHCVELDGALGVWPSNKLEKKAKAKAIFRFDVDRLRRTYQTEKGPFRAAVCYRESVEHIQRLAQGHQRLRGLIEEQDDRGKNVLHRAVESAAAPDVIKYLLDNSFHAASAKDEDECTPLQIYNGILRLDSVMAMVRANIISQGTDGLVFVKDISALLERVATESDTTMENYRLMSHREQEQFCGKCEEALRSAFDEHVQGRDLRVMKATVRIRIGLVLHPSWGLVSLRPRTGAKDGTDKMDITAFVEQHNKQPIIQAGGRPLQVAAFDYDEVAEYDEKARDVLLQHTEPLYTASLYDSLYVEKQAKHNKTGQGNAKSTKVKAMRDQKKKKKTRNRASNAAQELKQNNKEWDQNEIPYIFRGLPLLVNDWDSAGFGLSQKDALLKQRAVDDGGAKSLLSWVSPLHHGDASLIWLANKNEEPDTSNYALPLSSSDEYLLDYRQTVLYQAVESMAHPSILLFLLDSWPDAVKIEQARGTPLKRAAELRLPLEATIRMLFASAGLKELSKTEATILSQNGVLRHLAQLLHQRLPEHQALIRQSLEKPANTIFACLSIAKALRKERDIDPGRAVLYTHAIKDLIEMATELAIVLDKKIVQLPDRSKYEVVAAVLQPDPEETIASAVTLGNTEFLSVPWVMDFVVMLSGSSLTFLYNNSRLESIEEHDAGLHKLRTLLKGPAEGTLRRHLPIFKLIPNLHHAQFIDREVIVTQLGAIWPYELVAACAYAYAGLLHPHAVYKAPLARYGIAMVFYLLFLSLYLSSVVMAGSEEQQTDIYALTDIHTNIHDAVGDTVDDVMEGSVDSVWRRYAQLVAKWYSVLYLSGALLQSLNEMRSCTPFPFERFWTIWNVVDLTTSVLVLGSFLAERSHSEYVPTLRSWAALLLCLKLLEPLQLVQGLGTVMAIIGRLGMTLVHFLLMFTCLLLAFGVGMHTLLKDDTPDAFHVHDQTWA
jgi:hypothetical protein